MTKQLSILIALETTSEDPTHHPRAVLDDIAEFICNHDAPVSSDIQVVESFTCSHCNDVFVGVKPIEVQEYSRHDLYCSDDCLNNASEADGMDRAIRSIGA